MIIFSVIMIILGLFLANLGISDYHNPDKDKTLSAILVFNWSMVIISNLMAIHKLI